VAALFEAEALAVHLENVDMMGEPVEQRAGQAFGTEDAGPFIEWQIAVRAAATVFMLKLANIPAWPQADAKRQAAG